MRTSALALIALAACSSQSRPPPAPVFDQALTTDFDVLFVIDDTSSMGDKQTVFAANLPDLVQALDTFPTGRPNLHIGVVSTTVDIGVGQWGPGCPSPAPNDDGLLQNTPRVTGCSPPTGRFVIDVADPSGGRTTNYVGTIDQTLSCIAQLGATGCPFEAPLEAMKRALDGSRPENAGFLRDGAYLVVVFLAEEDDCSADPALFELPASEAGAGDFRCTAYAYDCDQPISTTDAGIYHDCHVRTGSYMHDPATYFQFLETLKPPGQILVATVIGDPESTIQTTVITTSSGSTVMPEPSCTATINGNPTSADAGLRLADFAGQAGPGRSQFYSICHGDYSAELAAIGELMRAAGTGCVLGPAPAVPTCTVTDDSTLLPACGATSAKPCWSTTVDEVACPATDSHVQLHVERDTPPPPGTQTRFRCN